MMNVYKIRFRVGFNDLEGVVLSKNYEEAIDTIISYIEHNGDKNANKEHILGFEILHENILLPENYLRK